jgi:adenosylcobinamide kinase/adenosylcobinamide-phosphate guanylyltransferase
MDSIVSGKTTGRRASFMMHLITGGSASGKSSYAESEAMATGRSNRFYLATMQPYGEEGRSRVEKHRAMRAGKGFRTIECFEHLDRLRLYDDAQRIPDNTVILLECISNLTANEQFGEGGTDDEIIARILSGIEVIKTISQDQIIVTNEVFSDGISYDADTMRYIGILGRINQALAQQADRVTEVVYGIPLRIK